MTIDRLTSSCCPLPIGDSKSKDLLGFTPSVEALATIVHSFKAPFTIGVYGDWGSGKTSYMRMLFDDLKEDKGNYIPIWFNAWKYESEGSVVLPLLSKMSEQWEDIAPIRSKFKSVKKIATAVTLLGADIGLKAVTANQVSFGNIESSLNKAESYLSDSYDNWVSQCDALEEGFRSLVDTLTNNGKKTIVVFIDDLDRCAPENVVKLLESIKNYLSLDKCHCLFVIGVDKQVIAKGIRAKYGSDLVDGDEYLEKIISYSVDVPRPNIDSIEKYVTENIKSLLKSEVYSSLYDDINILTASLARYRITNPRKLKRLLPRLVYTLIQPDYKEFMIEVIVYLVVLREYYPGVYKNKKDKLDINYMPSQPGVGLSNISFEEIKKEHGKDWAVLTKSSQEIFVRLCRVYDNDCRFITEKHTDSIEQRLKDSRLKNTTHGFNEMKITDLLERGVKRSPQEYFGKVESLFLLT